jgi:drug/metabolite transporter (DMT)-like permease
MKNFITLVLLACCWGPSFLFMKVAVEYIPPVSISAFRITLAATLLFIVLKIKKIKLPTNKTALRDFAIMGFFSSAFPFTMFTIGEQYIDSSMAAILNGTTSLFTLLLAHFATQNDRLTKAKFIGSIVGFFGLFVLIAPKLIEANATTIGILITGMAPISYAISLVYAKKHIHNYKPLVVPTAQLIFASLFLLPIAIIFENPASVLDASWQAVSSVIALSIIGTVIAFILYFKLIAETSATYASSATYLIPIFGIALGVLILDEELSWNIYLGTILILLGVMASNGIITQAKVKRLFGLKS